MAARESWDGKERIEENGEDLNSCEPQKGVLPRKEQRDGWMSEGLEVVEGNYKSVWSPTAQFVMHDFTLRGVTVDYSEDCSDGRDHISWNSENLQHSKQSRARSRCSMYFR